MSVKGKPAEFALVAVSAAGYCSWLLASIGANAMVSENVILHPLPYRSNHCSVALLPRWQMCAPGLFEAEQALGSIRQRLRRNVACPTAIRSPTSTFGRCR